MGAAGVEVVDRERDAVLEAGLKAGKKIEDFAV